MRRHGARRHEGQRVGSSGDTALDVRRPDPPLRDESIRGQPAMQGTARQPIDVLLVFLDEHAKLREVQVGVECEQRIVGPLDEVDAERQRPITLDEFQLAAEPRYLRNAGSTPSMCDQWDSAPRYIAGIE